MGRALSGSGERPAWVAGATFAAEAAAVALLAYLIARLVVSFYPPLVETPLGLGAPRIEQPARAWSVLDPFRRGALPTAVEATVAEAPVTTLNLTLVGLRAEGEGRGSAIIQTPDNQQRPYAVGDEILDGVTLAAVEAGFVTMRRADGAVERLGFAERASLIGGAAGSEATQDAQAAVPTTSVGAIDMAALLADIMPYDRVEEGIVVTPGADGSVFAAAGLEPLDVVRRVNGVGLSRPDDWQEALDGVGPGATVLVEVLRGDAPLTLSLIVE